MVGIILQFLAPNTGLVNHILQLLGFKQIDFMARPQLFAHIYVWSGLWQTVGFSCVIYLAALSGVDPTLHEAAIVDGASPLQLFRLVYLPLMAPSLVAVGIYALLLAWNEYLYAFLLLSSDKDVTLAVALGQFMSADDSPWELLMTTGLLYALPPAAIYYVFKRYMQAGLTAGAVKA